LLVRSKEGSIINYLNEWIIATNTLQPVARASEGKNCMWENENISFKSIFLISHTSLTRMLEHTLIPMEKKDKYRRMLKTEKYEATGTLSSPLSG
jgi:hypothetical protein